MPLSLAIKSFIGLPFTSPPDSSTEEDFGFEKYRLAANKFCSDLDIFNMISLAFSKLERIKHNQLVIDVLQPSVDSGFRF